MFHVKHFKKFSPLDFIFRIWYNAINTHTKRERDVTRMSLFPLFIFIHTQRYIMAETRKTMSKSRNQLRNMIYAALFLALAQVLPLVTANIPAIATMISPMHIPAFLC